MSGVRSVGSLGFSVVFRSAVANVTGTKITDVHILRIAPARVFLGKHRRTLLDEPERRALDVVQIAAAAVTFMINVGVDTGLGWLEQVAALVDNKLVRSIEDGTMQAILREKGMPSVVVTYVSMPKLEAAPVASPPPSLPPPPSPPPPPPRDTTWWKQVGFKSRNELYTVGVSILIGFFVLCLVLYLYNQRARRSRVISVDERARAMVGGTTDKAMISVDMQKKLAGVSKRLQLKAKAHRDEPTTEDGAIVAAPPPAIEDPLPLAFKKEEDGDEENLAEDDDRDIDTPPIDPQARARDSLLNLNPYSLKDPRATALLAALDGPSTAPAPTASAAQAPARTKLWNLFGTKSEDPSSQEQGNQPPPPAPSVPFVSLADVHGPPRDVT